MNVLMAEEMGFCFGVRRAVDLAQQAAFASQPVWTLGPLVHNAQVVERLESQGIGSVSSLDDIQSGTVVIASHGVTPEVTLSAQARGLKVVDATCPMVRASQVQAKELVDKGFEVVLFGDAHHAEVQGIHGWTSGKAIVLTDRSGLAHLRPAKRIALLAQSTQNAGAYLEMAKGMLDAYLGSSTEVLILNTICDATAKRQDAAANLARQVSVAIVVGGRDSANTRRLTEVLLTAGASAHQVEQAAEIDPAWVAGQPAVGITAGASTPDWVIEEVVTALGLIGG
jgi:(E)-4-hydroxy-3-methyl-but-2-enyl pyrophosphate reductase